MEYISSSQSSISSLNRKEYFNHFAFNVTSPILKKKKKKKKLVVGKLVDQVKKFKKQAPKIHDYIDGNDDIGYHSNDQIAIYDTKDTSDVATTAAVSEFFVSEVPTYKSNYPENQNHHKFLSRIKHYHSSHLHIITSMIQSDGEYDDDEEEEEEKENLNSSKTKHHHRQYLKMTRPTRRYFRKKKKQKEHSSIYSFSSIPSTAVISHKRNKLRINLTNKKKKRATKKKSAVRLDVYDDEKEEEKRKLLSQIRHQMMDFKIPADWTCISSKVNKNPTTTTADFDIIQDNNSLNDKIDNEMKRIQLNKLHIEDYINQIEQLNIDIEHHFHLFSSIDTKSRGLEQSLIDLKKSRLLLQQAHNRHLKLLMKNTTNPSIRLENLQIKVQSLHKSDFLGSNFRRWTFSFGN